MKGHLGLQVERSLSKAMESIRVHVPPKPFLQLPQLRVTKVKKKKLQDEMSHSFQKHFTRYGSSFCEALSAQDMNSAWAVLGKLGEAIFSDFSLQKGEGGHNCPPKFDLQKVAAPSASARHPARVHQKKVNVFA